MQRVLFSSERLMIENFISMKTIIFILQLWVLKNGIKDAIVQYAA